MSLTHAEQLSSPVLERVASRSTSGWVYCIRAACASDCASEYSCARAAANSYPPASKKPCARVVVLLRPKLCTWAITRSVPEKLRATVGRALPQLFYKNSCGWFRRCTFILLRRRPNELYEQVLWARKARAKDSCRNFIPKSIFKILLHKILKFSIRLNFKILTKPDSKLQWSRIMKFYPAKF